MSPAWRNSSKPRASEGTADRWRPTGASRSRTQNFAAQPVDNADPEGEDEYRAASICWTPRGARWMPRFLIEHGSNAEYSLVSRSSDGQMLFLANMLSKLKHGAG